MKYHLLLLEDVINHGRKGDLAYAAPGFARNYLLPQGKAIVVSKANLRIKERLQKERNEQAVKDHAESERIAAILRGQTFETVVKVDPDGHMYGSVTTADIAEMLRGQGFDHVEKKHVLLIQPLRQIGQHQVSLKLPEGVELSIALLLKPDREIKKKAVREEARPAEEAYVENADAPLEEDRE